MLQSETVGPHQEKFEERPDAKKGLITESVTYADLRKDQPVYCCDKSGDGWSVVRFLPEEIVSHMNEDGSITKDIEVPSCVFVQAFIPTSYWEPHPWWKFGVEHKGERSSSDPVREQQGEWFRVPEYSEAPRIPEKSIKRWREPCDTGHTDGAENSDGNNIHMEYNRDDRIIYGQNRFVGTIIGPAHPLLNSWYVTPERNPVEKVIVQTADIQRLRGDNVPPTWRRSAAAIETIETDEETAEEARSPQRKVSQKKKAHCFARPTATL